LKKALNKFAVGDRVEVYGLMNPLRDLVKIAVIDYVGPMHSGGQDMVWFECGGGAWHPDACKLIHLSQNLKD